MQTAQFRDAEGRGWVGVLTVAALPDIRERVVELRVLRSSPRDR
jgi:hypothetical protein